jgi:hypothetical protein
MAALPIFGMGRSSTMLHTSSMTRHRSGNRGAARVESFSGPHWTRFPHSRDGRTPSLRAAVRKSSAISLSLGAAGHLPKIVALWGQTGYVRTGRETAGTCGPTTKPLTSPVPPRRRLVEDNMGAAPMALPRRAGAGGIMMGIPTQPFRAGLTFSGRPSGPR